MLLFIKYTEMRVISIVNYILLTFDINDGQYNLIPEIIKLHACAHNFKLNLKP